MSTDAKAEDPRHDVACDALKGDRDRLERDRLDRLERDRLERERECAAAKGLTTGDLARACETTVRTVRFYEEAGVLCPEARTDGGHRMFDEQDLTKLQLIMDLREAGLSLSDIRALFELKAQHPTAEAASRAMSGMLEDQIEAMHRKIETLRRLREELALTVAMMRECRSCERQDFPVACSGCDVVNRPGLPRAMRLLWNDEPPK